MDYIIEHVTDREIEILETHNINWEPVTVNSAKKYSTIALPSQEEHDNALKLIRYGKTWGVLN